MLYFLIGLPPNNLHKMSVQTVRLRYPSNWKREGKSKLASLCPARLVHYAYRCYCWVTSYFVFNNDYISACSLQHVCNSYTKETRNNFHISGFSWDEVILFSSNLCRLILLGYHLQCQLVAYNFAYSRFFGHFYWSQFCSKSNLQFFTSHNGSSTTCARHDKYFLKLNSSSVLKPTNFPLKIWFSSVFYQWRLFTLVGSMCLYVSLYLFPNLFYNVLNAHCFDFMITSILC